MAREIIISIRAQKEIRSELKYLKKKWSKNMAATFYDTLWESFSKINKNPDWYPLIKGKDECVYRHNKIISIFYRFNEERLDIISVFNNRRKPGSLRLKK
ncbi:MAG: hypothetical protein H6581_19775 [Bacteroidia bacterium]|nr:hypothetical protein [Bacteroidia bacterium]